MATIKCGNCGHLHGSTQDVRNCYSGLDHNVPIVSHEDELLTDRQRSFLAVLRTERGLLTDGIGKLSMREASDEISGHLSPKGKQAKMDFEARTQNRASIRQEATQAQARVYTPAGTVPAPLHSSKWERFEDIPAGHYAVPSLTGNNDLYFFRVDRPTEGPWQGRYFVKRVIGGKPDSKVRGKTVLEAMQAIRKADPDKAAILYGQEIGRCFRCNRHLTDETSRALGIGPDCRSRL